MAPRILITSTDFLPVHGCDRTSEILHLGYRSFDDFQDHGPFPLPPVVASGGLHSEAFESF
jgi:hypothetical protein